MSRRNGFQKAKDRARLAEMYLQGHSQHDMSMEIGISVAQVYRDLRILQDNWMASQLMNINQAKAEQLAKLDLLELEAWQAWDRSKIDKSGKSVEKSGEDEKRVKAWSEGRLPDPRYLQVIQHCIERRCKILGLDQPDQHRHIHSEQTQEERAVAALSDTELEKLKRSLKTRSRATRDPTVH